MKLFLFNQTSAFAGGGQGALTGPAEGRQANPFGGGAAEKAAQRAFAAQLVTRGQRAQAARAAARARAGR
jgi:hypothetical protein